jgi:hypothetical protein
VHVAPPRSTFDTGKAKNLGHPVAYVHVERKLRHLEIDPGRQAILHTPSLNDRNVMRL